jgi:hypothetical protein
MRKHLPGDNIFYGMNYHKAGFRAYNVTVDAADRDIRINGAGRTVKYFYELARKIPLDGIPVCI